MFRLPSSSPSNPEGVSSPTVAPSSSCGYFSFRLARMRALTSSASSATAGRSNIMPTSRAADANTVVLRVFFICKLS
jgi:hypothetical protein